MPDGADDDGSYNTITVQSLLPPSDWKRPPGRPNHTWLRALSRVRDRRTSVVSTRGRKQLLGNTGVRLWTRVRSKGVRREETDTQRQREGRKEGGRERDGGDDDKRSLNHRDDDAV